MPKGLGVTLILVTAAIAVAVLSLGADNVWIAVVSGVVISVLSWLATLVFIGPRLAVSEYISVVEDAGPTRSDTRYRVKILNRSRLFDVGDVSLQAQLVAIGLNPLKPKNATAFDLPISSGMPFPILYRRSRSWRKKRLNWERKRAGRVYTLRHRDLSGGGIERLTEPVAKKLAEGELELEELLNRSEDSFVRLVVTAAHPLSGYRRWTTVFYDRTHISSGIFAPHDSVTLKETRNGQTVTVGRRWGVR